MDEFDTAAEELVTMFTDRDELSANIGDAMREMVRKAEQAEREAIARMVDGMGFAAGKMSAKIISEGDIFEAQADAMSALAAAIRARSEGGA